MRYTDGYRIQKKQGRGKAKLLVFVSVVLVVAGGFVAYRLLQPSVEQQAAKQLHFDESVTDVEKERISQSIIEQFRELPSSTTVSVKTILGHAQDQLTLTAYVPVTNIYAARQKLTTAELSALKLFVPRDTNATIQKALTDTLKVEESFIRPLDTDVEAISQAAVAFVPVDTLGPKVKLLTFDDGYYLDNFRLGGVSRVVTFSGDGAERLKDLKLNNLPSKASVLKTNMTGVTALTRVMLKKLQGNNDPLYFSQKIGKFLGDADITHISNEVSFKDGCQYHDALFCSDPRFIETLKDSGVDIVELTGNHNNDFGHQYNTDTIKLYHNLGWQTIGGGLTSAEAAKFYVADQKQTQVAFLAYNYPDSPNGTAIAGANTAGANSFDFERIKNDIATAKSQADYVIVDIQFWECYAYPDGYVEFPVCDKPIINQREVFQKVADLGASMVIGTSAHQPQTYELYKDVPVYYGLGNLYFDQTSWPGTERGIILSHYFWNGKLLQTKLTPTVYDDALQTRIMNDTEATALLQRLNTAR